jgi:dinuclear metal center YbgI/SA1388 family protein
MVALSELVQYCDTLLDVGSYQDYCPNGLQIEGRAEVRSIVAGVSASQALIDAALEQGADLLLVHHGYFWKGEAGPLTGIKRNRIKALLANDVSLLAYHLPLDGHPEHGNNAQLGRLWGIECEGRFGNGPNGGLGMIGSLPQPMPLEELAQFIGGPLQREPLVIEGGKHPVQRVGWCSGAAQDYIETAAALGLDAFISGEISEQTVHAARELGIHYLSAGHHATERYGVQALGQFISDYFPLKYRFVDIANPV